MSLIKKAFFLSMAWLLGLIFVLIFFEVALRVIYDRDFIKRSYQDERVIPSQVASELSILTNFEFEYDINKHYKAKESKIKYVRDKYGLRNACGDPKNIDILTIGGSTTDQDRVKNESTYQAVLEKLASDYLSKEICVANAGINGHSTYGHIRAFEEWFPLLPDLKPEYVLLYVGINDAVLDRNYELMCGGSCNRRPIKAFIRKTYIAQKTRPFFQYIRGERVIAERNKEKFSLSNYTVMNLGDGVAEKIKANTIAFQERFEKILGYVEEMESTPICVTQPHRFAKVVNGKKKGLININRGYSGLDYEYAIQEINKVMKKLCGDNIIDIYSVELKEHMFYDGVHTTDIGSEFIGKKMFEAMKEKGMLKRL